MDLELREGLLARLVADAPTEGEGLARRGADAGEVEVARGAAAGPERPVGQAVDAAARRGGGVPGGRQVQGLAEAARADDVAAHGRELAHEEALARYSERSLGQAASVPPGAAMAKSSFAMTISWAPWFSMTT